MSNVSKRHPVLVLFGNLFSQKNEKRGFQKSPKNQSQKQSKWVPNRGGGFDNFCVFLGSDPCSDPLCCWNAPGPPFFTILASLFLHFCVAARYKEQLFNKKTNKGGSRKVLKIRPKKSSKWVPNRGVFFLGVGVLF